MAIALKSIPILGMTLQRVQSSIEYSLRNKHDVFAAFFEAIPQVKDEAELRSQLVPYLGEHFAAKRAGVFFFDHLPVTNRSLQKLLNVALSIEHNPVARYITERHTAVHEELVTSPKAWVIICPRPDHWHVMARPILERGQLVGAVGALVTNQCLRLMPKISQI